MGVCKTFFEGRLQKAFTIGVCNGRLQNAPTQHTLKVIDYQR